jgi:hypothetical protein
MRYLVGIMMLVALGVASLAGPAPSTSADYPPPVGSLSGAASDTTPALGDTVQVTCTALDSSGQPMVDVPCTFTLTSNPGDASFGGELSTTVETDENGVATAFLNTGSQSGVIVVSVEATGILSQVTITAGAPQGLPETGGSPTPLDSSGTPVWPLLAGLASAAALMALGGGWFVAQKTRRQGI